MNELSFGDKKIKENNAANIRAESEILTREEVEKRLNREILEIESATEKASASDPKEFDKFFDQLETKRKELAREQAKISSLKSYKEQLKKENAKDKDLIKKKRGEICAREVEAIVKELEKRQPGTLDLFRKSAILYEAVENEKIVKQVPHYRAGLLLCEILNEEKKKIYRNDQPEVIHKKGIHYNLPYDLDYTERREEKKVLAHLGIQAAIELERLGELRILDDVSKLEVEFENRWSDLPAIFDQLASLKIFLLPSNGNLPPDLQEFAEKGVAVTIFDIARTISENEKKKYIKELFDK